MLVQYVLHTRGMSAVITFVGSQNQSTVRYGAD